MLDRMPMNFTGWELAELALFFSWPYALCLLMVFMLGAIAASGWLRRTFWFSAGTIVAVYGVTAAVVLVPMGLDKLSDARLARMRKPITQERTLRGATLPAGTTIEWVSTRQLDFNGVTLSGVTQVLGVPMTGVLRYDEDPVLADVEPNGRHFWQGQLPVDRTIDGWPCKAGDVALDDQGKLHRCTLLTLRRFGGHVVPGGSAVDVREQEVRVTLAGAMAMPEIKGVFAHKNVVRFDEHGCVLGATVYDETPMTVHGVKLWSNTLHLHRDAGEACGPVAWVRGNLKYAEKGAEDTFGGTEVDVAVATGCGAGGACGRPGVARLYKQTAGPSAPFIADSLMV